MTDILLWTACIVGVCFVPVCAYLGLLALLARVPPSPEHGDAVHRFIIVVPAHNEQGAIKQTVASLGALDYDKDKYKVVVIADNCTDDTAGAARDAGAEVLERTNKDERGKGYALDHAFETLASPDMDAFVIVDADTLVSRNLLRAFDRCVGDGAAAAQAEYGVSNPEASWRTRLMTIALAMFHRLRMLARERLGLSVGLRGNGMCFSRALLKDIPHKAHGLVEDVEFGVRLALGGHRVMYAHEAEVRGEMVSTGAAAVSQRKRWEGGRFDLIRTHLPALAGRAFKKRDGVALDLAIDLLIPPLSYVALGAALNAGLLMGAVFIGGLQSPTTAHTVAATALLLNALGLGAYVSRGVALSGFGLRAWGWLAWAPVYMVWKFAVAPFWSKPEQWVRTQREAQPGSPAQPPTKDESV